MERITLTRPSFTGKNATDPPSLSSGIITYTDVSFSTYLNPEKNTNNLQSHDQSNSLDDNELSVFDAQKYFNEGNEQQQSNRVSPINTNLDSGISEQYEVSRFSSVTSSSSVDAYSARNYRARSFHATPTASSEASWNSQTGLLSNPPNSIKVSLRNLSNSEFDRERKKHSGSRGTKWFFGRKCPCTGRKSLQVDEDNIESKSPVHFSSKQPHRFSPEKIHFPPNSNNPTGLNHTIQLPQGRSHNDCTTAFSFPILKPSTNTTKIILKSNFVQEDPPRDSLEVFHPPDDLMLHKKNKSRELHVSNINNNLIEDDLASDGSSDLFEIESFSTQTTSYQPYGNDRRNSLDEASNFRRMAQLGVSRGLFEERRRSIDEPATPSVAPSELYEPSEVSVDWSVTTAEGFDRASVATYDDRSEAENYGNESGRKKGGNGLLGCRCEKAVSVGPSPFRMGPPQVMTTSRLVNMNSSRPYTYGTSHNNHDVKYNKPPLGVGVGVGGRAHPARVSLAFAA